MKVVTSDNYVKRDSGLILWDIAVGKGDSPKDGQQVFSFENRLYLVAVRSLDTLHFCCSPCVFFHVSIFIHKKLLRLFCLQHYSNL